MIDFNNADNDNEYPLSPIQAGMLFHTLEALVSGVYIQQFVIGFHEGVKTAAFHQAAQCLIDTHPVLRTSFDWQGSAPRQYVQPQAELEWQEHDWHDLETAVQEEQWQAYLAQDQERGFDLTQAPLMRFALFRMGDAEYRCLWTSHHIIFDGRSRAILLKELFAHYDAIISGKPAQITPSRPYRDFIAWQQQYTPVDAPEFWTKLLHNADVSLSLPAATATDVAGEDEYGKVTATLSVDTTRVLTALAKTHDITLNTFIQGAWVMMLSAFTGQTDILFGATRAGRHTIEGSVDMVGMFINTLPVRAQIDPTAPLLTVLRDLRQQAVAMRPYEHIPLTDIRKMSGLPPAAPLFPTIIVFENYKVNEAMQLLGEGWGRRTFELIDRVEYPLAGSAYGGEQLSLALAYELSSYTPQTAVRLLTHWQQLLEVMADGDLMQTARELPLLTPPERTLLDEWNNTAVSRPIAPLIPEQIAAQAARTPDAIAIVHENEPITYRQLNEQANQLAHHLQKLGVETGTLVGLFLPRSPALLISMLAVLKAGGAYVPLNPDDPNGRLSLILADAAPPILITHADQRGKLSAYQGRWVDVAADHALIAAEPSANPPTIAHADSLAYVIYTSGSTGTPKGVMVEHRAFAHFTAAATSAYHVTAADRVLQFAAASFDASIEEIFPCLTQGGTLYLRTDEMLGSTAVFWQQCRQWELTVLDLPTAYWHRLAHAPIVPPPSLRLLIIGGEAAQAEAMGAWFAQQSAVKIRVVNSYGPTEATVVATLMDMRGGEGGSVPIGRPLENVTAYVMNNDLRPLPAGFWGELCLGGAGLARGYWQQPALTAEKFVNVALPSGETARLYRTGDVVRRRADGVLEFGGRRDDQVKIRGYRVELGEIEAALQQVEGVKTAVILPIPTAFEPQLAAYVVADSGDAETWRRALSARLPAYMIPTSFTILEQFPLTNSGKIDRQQLPAPDFSPSTESFIAPRDELELLLSKLWEDVLEVTPIGIHDNFFALGGHSLLAIRLFADIDRLTGRKLPLATLFESPTIAQLAQILRDDDWSPPWSLLIPVQSGGSKRPFFCVGGGLGLGRLSQHLGADQPLYKLDLDSASFVQVEEMAAACLEEIQTLQPTGPYLFGGFCFGGSIAYEMARQLQEKGEKTAVLALFDAAVPRSIRPVQEASHTRRSASRLRRYADKIKGMDLREQIDFVWMRVKNGWRAAVWYRLWSLLHRFYAWRKRPLPAIFHDHDNYYRRAAKDYVPQSYEGTAVLFEGEGRKFLLSGDPSEDWKRVITGGVRVCNVSGHHADIFKEPHIKQLAQRLEETIANSERS